MKKCKKVVFYSYVNSGNRGCEAILKSTYDILGLGKDQNETLIFTDDVEGDTKCGIDKYGKLFSIPYIYNHQFKPLTSVFPRFLRTLKIDKNALWKYKYNRYASEFTSDTLALSTGGDIYCYDDSDWLTYLNNLALKKGAKTVLWGCSIEKSRITDFVKEDLKKYSLITVRESITLNNLKEMGITDNVKMFPDPAFKLKPETADIFEWGKMGKVLGINISSHIIKDQKVYKEFIRFVNHVLETTEYSVLLIPHVFWEDEDDLKMLSDFSKELTLKDKVYLVDRAYSSQELKYIISKCTMYMGARTHSVIAAYSMFVPTVALSYSIKSRGIARDIFGDEKNYTLKISNQTTFDELWDSFQFLEKNQGQIKQYLENELPKYIEKIDSEKEVIEKLFGGKYEK